MRPTLTTDERELREYLDYLVDNPEVPFSVFDLETTSLKINADIIYAGWYDFKNEPMCVYTDVVFDGGMPQDLLIEILREYMPQLIVIGHNIKFDLGILKAKGISDPKVKVDTILMCHMWDPDQLKKLEVRVTKDLKYEKKTYEQIIGKKWAAIDYEKDTKPSVDKKGNKVPALITPENMGHYLGEDVYWTGQLYLHYEEKLTRSMRRIMNDIEMPLMWTLRDMHHHGVRVDPEVLKPLDEKLTVMIKEEEEAIYDAAGSVFNMNSPKQVGEILYDKLGIDCIKTTKKGARSCDSATLKVYAEEGWDICQHMVNYSEYETLQSMYTKNIPLMIDADGRLRGSFNATGAASGRLSAAQPNLQNIPTRKELGRIIRQAFIPADGWDFWDADMSQIEPRIATHMSEDPGLIKIYKNRGDIYTGIAEALSISRDDAKIILLAIFYGMGSRKLARSVKVSLAEAKSFIKGIYTTYPKFAAWKEGIESYAKRNKCVYTLFGRVRKFPLLTSSAGEEAYFGSLRAAFNSVIQGSAADMLKIAMLKTHQRLKGMQARLLLTVHDEIAGESPIWETERAGKILVDCMENTVKLIIPVVAEFKVVQNWSQMKDKKFKGIDRSSRSLLPLLFNRA